MNRIGSKHSMHLQSADLLPGSSYIFYSFHLMYCLHNYQIPVFFQCESVGRVGDVIRIPAFLCRQTDLLVAAAKTGRIINIKKGQFCAPSVMGYSAEKIRLAGNPNVMVCERGTMFGYSKLF
ncbi:hypothetical protein HRI_003131100 [Hibiscus trionum]|uniref:3-deoxy-8-phosphooctulonate synthase n=1 Tax=Hibiscus trionum TaxID=183268 RepID=A0A9W7IFV5_HIBTR|nr:hypothetical protein HRI_003131100 [Hibiscus trionum]